jgi:hypothetical protein
LGLLMFQSIYYSLLSQLLELDVRLVTPLGDLSLLSGKGAPALALMWSGRFPGFTTRPD